MFFCKKLVVTSGKWIMGGEMTVDNCYGLLGLTSEPQKICNKATIDDSELWHQRLGHLNFTDLLARKLSKIYPRWRKLGKEFVVHAS